MPGDIIKSQATPIVGDDWHPDRYRSQKDWFDTERSSGYDMEGYVKKYGLGQILKGGHLTDEFKLPNHITFSTDSMYSNDKTPGGLWQQISGIWHYAPSTHVLSQHSPEKLIDYFTKYEPNAVLDLPTME